MPGNTVVVPAKNVEKAALVHSVMDCIPRVLDLNGSNFCHE